MKSLCASLLLFLTLGVDAQRQKPNPITWSFGSSVQAMKTLYPGDRLTFTYTAPTHNVAMLPDNGDVTPIASGSGDNSTTSDNSTTTGGGGADMDPCAMKASAKILDTTGSFTWIAPIVTSDESYWFLCTKQDHCSAGNMKLKVTVKMPTHVVSDWDIHQNFENMTINVGDTLAFDFNTTDHDVQKFSDETAYNNCDFTGATMECDQAGPCTIQVDSSMQGESYFGCSKSDHCKNGDQKMALTVESGATATTASLATVLLGSLALLFTNKRL